MTIDCSRASCGACHGVHAPEDRLDACEQFLDAEWLGEVIVGAAFEPHDLVDVARPGGQHQHGHVPVHRPQLAADLETVDARQHHVEQDEVEWLVRQRNRFLARSGELHLAPDALDVALDDFRQVSLVFDDQDLATTRGFNAPGSNHRQAYSCPFEAASFWISRFMSAAVRPE